MKISLKFIVLFIVCRFTVYGDKLQNIKTNHENLNPRILSTDHHHKLFHSFNESRTSHKKAWKALEIVDGLRNEDIVILVTSTAGNAGKTTYFHTLRERVIASARTWMRYVANVFVMIEDTFQTRVAMRHCKLVEYSRFTTFECHNEPTYVLTRNCTNAYYKGPGICCKVDDLFTFLTHDKPELFAHTKYALEFDDDTYIRVDQVMRWLAKIENTGINTHPWIASPHTELNIKDGLYGLKEGCEEIHPYGWYQPFILNHAAMQRMKNAHSKYGLTSVCNNFGISQDVALGAFAWMFDIYHLYLPGTKVDIDFFYDFETHLPRSYMILHPVKHTNYWDYCETHTYDQRIIIGCGDLGRPHPDHHPNTTIKPGQVLMNADMYDAWEWYRVNGTEVNILTPVHGYTSFPYKNVTLYPNGTMLPGISTIGDENKVKIKHILQPQDTIESDGTFNGSKVVWHQVADLTRFIGYEKTQHSKKYDVANDWHEFKLTDCVKPGVWNHD